MRWFIIHCNPNHLLSHRTGWSFQQSASSTTNKTRSIWCGRSWITRQVTEVIHFVSIQIHIKVRQHRRFIASALHLLHFVDIIIIRTYFITAETSDFRPSDEKAQRIRLPFIIRKNLEILTKWRRFPWISFYVFGSQCFRFRRNA